MTEKAKLHTYRLVIGIYSFLYDILFLQILCSVALFELNVI